MKRYMLILTSVLAVLVLGMSVVLASSSMKDIAIPPFAKEGPFFAPPALPSKGQPLPPVSEYAQCWHNCAVEYQIRVMNARSTCTGEHRVYCINQAVSVARRIYDECVAKCEGLSTIVQPR